MKSKQKKDSKETLICHKCGGTGKPSKGYMNFHNIQTSDRSKEFETKLLDCIKCTSCGHSWIPETSTREQALIWWNNLPVWGIPSKEYYMGLYYSDDKVTPERIEEIYDKEVLEPKRQEEWQESQVNCRYTKPNAKEFKQLDESLFKSYMDKFSTRDLSIAFDVFITRLLKDGFIKDNLIEAIKNK